MAKNEIFKARLTLQEKEDYARKAQRCCLDMSALFRLLIKGYEPKEKPDEEFYAHMRELSGIANNINQLTMKAHTYGGIDAARLEAELERLNQFQLAIEKKYLEPEKSRLWQ